MNVIEASGLSFSYPLGVRVVEILKGVSFSVKKGELIAIEGRSGSGKSTLFYMLGCLLRPTQGKLLIEGQDASSLSDEELAAVRSRKIGFVFQQFHLLPHATVLENILLPDQYADGDDSTREAKEKLASELVERLGLSGCGHRMPNQLSGGQQQRVAIARALINDPEIILADEPTGNLDSVNAEQILSLLVSLRRLGKTIILVTHDPQIAKHCDRTLKVSDGTLQSSEPLLDSKAGESARPIIAPTSRDSVEKNLAERIRAGMKAISEARRNLGRNRLRAFATMIGVIIAVAALLTVVTLGDYTKSRILKTYESIGVNRLLVRGGFNWRIQAVDRVPAMFSGYFSLDEIARLKTLFPDIELMSPIVRTIGKVSVNGVPIDGLVISGVLPEFQKISAVRLLAGQELNSYHTQDRSQVCMVSESLFELLRGQRADAPQLLSLSLESEPNAACRVIGRFSFPESADAFGRPRYSILMPITTFYSSFAFKLHPLTDIELQIAAGKSVNDTGIRIKNYFEQKYGKSIVMRVDSNSTLIAQMKFSLHIFTLLLTGVAFISLIIGGIGISNMMLVTVGERVREFGLRRALGASRRNIRLQVMTESFLISSVAGVIGVGVGFVIYESIILVASRFVSNLSFQWLFSPVASIICSLAIVATGLLSGLIPAIQAEQKEVIEALRTE